MTVVLIFLLNPGRSKDGIRKEGKHKTSAILSKLDALVDFLWGNNRLYEICTLRYV